MEEVTEEFEELTEELGEFTEELEELIEELEELTEELTSNKTTDAELMLGLIMWNCCLKIKFELIIAQ